VFCLLGAALATVGIDTSGGDCDGASSSDFTCLHNSGYDFAIIQTWQGGYGYTSKIADCVSWAWSAGFAHVDVYIFMCPECSGNGDAASVVSTVFNNLKNAGVKYGMIWFDIEQCDGCWGSASTNAAYIAAACNEAISLGAHIGIYSSMYEWSQTMGGSTAFTKYPLWYADWDGEQDFNDGGYKFGGWTSPAMKQYSDNGPCMDVDSNWYPSSSESFMEMRQKWLAENQTLITLPIPEEHFPKVQVPVAPRISLRRH